MSARMSRIFWRGFNWGAIGISDAGRVVSSVAGLALSGTGAAMVAGGSAGWVGVGLVAATSAIISSASSFDGQAMTEPLAEFKNADTEEEGGSDLR